MSIQEKVEAYLGKPVAQASNKEIYDGPARCCTGDGGRERAHRQQEETLLHFSRVLIGNCSPTI